MELRSTDTHLQWRTGEQAEWIDLVALSDIAGPRGDAGAIGGQGEAGVPGADGKSAFDTAVSGGYAAGEDQFRRDLAAIGGLADALLAIIGE